MNFDSKEYTETRKKVLTLVKRKNRIKNYVSAISHNPIPVSFKSENDEPREKEYSMTHGNSIVIDADIECANDDHIIGHALHQAACVVNTDFEFLRDFREYPKYYVPDKVWERSVNRYDMDEELVHFLVLLIGNIIENKRLDHWLYNIAPGYRPYVDAMYRELYHSDEVIEALKTHKYAGREEIAVYMFYTMHVGNDLVDTSDLYALKEIYDLIDIDNITRLKSRQQVHHIACKVFNIIIRVCDDVEELDFEEFKDVLKNSLNGLMDDTVSFLMGEVDQETLKHSTSNEIEVFENPEIQNIQFNPTGLDAEVRCIFVKELNWGMFKDQTYGNLNEKILPESLEGVERGELLGHQLQEKLQIRNDEHSEKRTRKKSGLIDEANLAEIGYNDEIFMQIDVDKYEQLNIHISIDASGSMGGAKWVNAITSVVALAKAADGVQNVDIQISFRTTSYMSESGIDAAVIVGYDSKVNSFSHIRQFFPHIGPSGSTPEGLCYEATSDFILMNSSEDNLFINYSDGLPQTFVDGVSYSGDIAVTHTRKQINKMRNRGIQILSYYIGNSTTFGKNDGNSNSAFFSMYGENSQFVNPVDMSSIARTLNTKFLEKSDE